MAGDVRGGDLRSGSTVCLRRREEPARGGAGFRTEPGYDCQDVPLFGAARLCAIQGSGAAEARTARTGHRRDPGVRQNGAAQSGPGLGIFIASLGFSIRYTATIVVIVEIFAFSNRYTTP